MHAVIAIIKKDILQWTRRPLYFISSTLLAVLIIILVGNTLVGSTSMPFGLYDPADMSELAKNLSESPQFNVVVYKDQTRARKDLFEGKIIALAEVDQDLIEDSVRIVTEGHNPLVNDQISMGLISALTDRSSELSLPLDSVSLFPATFGLRDYITPGLVAYLCYVLACMNLGFSWIYEWMEKTYRQIVLAPYGLRSAIVAKTTAVTLEASVVLWLALTITAPVSGFTLGGNFLGLIGITLLSMFCFTCMGLGVACLLKTIRVYTMTITVFGVAIMFVSGIILPVEGMPVWEQFIAYSFPMYYAADAFKGIMLSIPADYTRDVIVLGGWSLVGLTFASVLLSRRKAVL